jgi:hypothetical protein
MNVEPFHGVAEEERAVALSLLRRAAERGKLTRPELDRRVALVRRAQLAGELAIALAGIDKYPFGVPPDHWPALPPPPAPVAARSRSRERSTTHGYGPDDPLTVSTGLQTETIGGRWIVPPYLRLHAGMSSVRIDCRCANAAASTVDIEIRAGITTIVLVLPDEWGADASGVRRNLGTLRIRVPRLPVRGYPTVVLHGGLGISTLVVRRENRVDRWRRPVEAR